MLRRTTWACVLALACVTACGKPAEPATAHEGSLAKEDPVALRLVAVPPKVGEPVELLGETSFICAVRHQAPMACVGEFGFPLRPVGEEPDRSRDYRVTRDSDMPIALAGFDPKEVRAPCVRDAAGQVLCWTGRASRPTLVPAVIEGLPSSASLSADEAQVCTASTGGSVHCWGQLLCIPGEEFEYRELALSKVAGVDDAVEVSVGAKIGCARRATGQVACWGHVESADACADQTAVQVPGIEDAVRVSAGFGEACAIDGRGRVSCWGRNERATLGVAYQDVPFSATPVAIELGEPVVEVLGADEQRVALTVSGKVWIWGGAMTRDDDPKPRRVADIDDAIDIVLGQGYGCALRADHSLRCFGPRVDRRPDQRPVIENKQAWIDAPVFEIWRDFDPASARGGRFERRDDGARVTP
jgi:hypothetical protein